MNEWTNEENGKRELPSVQAKTRKGWNLSPASFTQFTVVKTQTLPFSTAFEWMSRQLIQTLYPSMSGLKEALLIHLSMHEC